MKLKNKKIILISVISTIAIFLVFIPFNFNAGLLEILEEALTGAIAFLIRMIASAVAALINTMEAGMDKLIFNVASNFKEPTLLKHGNLTLLKNNALSTQLMTIYNLFIYIAVTILGSIGAWVTIDFIKTANDSRHKAVLKDRLKKIIISIVLLTSMPLLFDELMTINQVIVDVFRLVIINAGGGESVNGLFLSDIFKAMAEKDKSDIVLAAIYLMSTFINLWMVVFYMLRDLAISFLFIISPVIAIMLPYRTDLVLKWFKEMISNIFTQSIQAFVMAIVILIAAGLGDNAKLYDQIFALVAFASFIPLTAQVKKMLGLEGEIGAAKSNAGLGAVVGAVGLATAAYAGIKGASNKYKDANADVKNIEAEETLLKKSKFESNEVGGSTRTSNTGGIDTNRGIGSPNGINPQGPSPSGTTGGGRGIEIDPNNRTSSNRNFGVETQADYDDINNGKYTATSRARELQGIKANAKRQRNKALLSGVGGALGGAIMGLGTAAYGNPFISIMAARGGMNIGAGIGDMAGDNLTDLGQETTEFARDKIYGEGIRYDGEQNQALGSIFEGVDMKSRPDEMMDTIKNNFNRNKDIINYNKNDEVGNEEAMKRATGLDKYSMNARDYGIESDAILERNKLERKGKFAKAHRSYADNTYDRNVGYIPEFIDPPGNPKLSGVNPTLIGESPKDVLYPAGIPAPKTPQGPTKSIKPIDEVKTVESVKNTDKAIEDNIRPDVSNKIPSENNINNVNINDYYDEINSTLNELTKDILNYENNDDYLSAIEDMYANVEDIHIGNDYSQLI